MVKELERALKGNHKLDAGRARRTLISEATDCGMKGWPEQAIKFATDAQGNVLPLGGYEDER